MIKETIASGWYFIINLINFKISGLDIIFTIPILDILILEGYGL
jgi:hypothetical protein